jgi:ribonuclease J
MSDINDSIAEGSVRILFLGGLGEIGMNCMVLETMDSMIMIDCGLMFSDLEHFGVEFVIPDFTYVLDRAEKFKAIILTHGHEDHIGALAYLLKAGVNPKIYTSSFTTLMLREKLKEYGLDTSVRLNILKPGNSIECGDFKIAGEFVNHSIVESMAIFIDTPAGKVIHTGDFRFDSHPQFGKPLDLTPFKKAGEEGVLLLMSDSTNVERCSHNDSESVVKDELEKVVAAAEGLTIISMFSSNIGRMGQIVNIAKKMDKKIVLSGRSMEQNFRLAESAGYFKDVAPMLVSLDGIDQYERKKVIVLSTGSQGEGRSALVRISHGEHRDIELTRKDQVILSSKFIPGNEKAISRMINQLFKQGADVVYESVREIHVSGHATRPELKVMLETVKPKFFIPIHGEYRHLVHHARLAREVGIPENHIKIAVNGDVMELSSDHMRQVDHIEEPRVLIESREGSDISKLVLKERRQLGETGVVFVLMVREGDHGDIIAGPEVILKGLATGDDETQLVLEAKKIARRVIQKFNEGVDYGNYGGSRVDLQEAIRIDLRRFFQSKINKKPVVLPMMIDL